MTGKNKGLFQKVLNYETISYLIAGVLATLVDLGVFTLLNEALGRSGKLDEITAVMIAQVSSWAAAVLFAYITNKLLVFRNYDFSPSHLAAEASSFLAARVLSGLLVTLVIWVMVDLAGIDEYIAKLVTTVINVVFNYVASKLFIFKK